MITVTDTDARAAKRVLRYALIALLLMLALTITALCLSLTSQQPARPAATISQAAQ